MRRALYLLFLAACEDDDPCPGVETACVALTVKASTFDAIDELQLGILYDDRHGVITTALPQPMPVTLPLTTRIEVDLTRSARIGIVAAGRLTGAILGFGEGETKTIGIAEHVALEITLGGRMPCTPNEVFCGGDGFAGNRDTMYQCPAATNQGVPRARGRCLHGCARRTGADVCLAGPEKCMAGRYCGGNEVEGDPSTTYLCENQVGVDPVECADGCVINAGSNDTCR